MDNYKFTQTRKRKFFAILLSMTVLISGSVTLPRIFGSDNVESTENSSIEVDNTSGSAITVADSPVDMANTSLRAAGDVVTLSFENKEMVYDANDQQYFTVNHDDEYRSLITLDSSDVDYVITGSTGTAYDSNTKTYYFETGGNGDYNVTFKDFVSIGYDDKKLEPVAGYYYANNEYGFSNFRVNTGDSVTLTLEGTNKLENQNATGISTAPLNVKPGGALTINGSGTIDVKGSPFLGTTSSSGIGGNANEGNGKITIDSGTIVVTAPSTTYPGNTLQFGGAGIGSGGFEATDVEGTTTSGSSGESITINGGNITAKSGDQHSLFPYGYTGAGIGSGAGRNSNGINITGGTISAMSGNGHTGAAIGSGAIGDSANITITGGDVTAITGFSTHMSPYLDVRKGGSGIGSGVYGDSSNINISGGKVYAKSKTYAAGIGSGAFGDSNGINIFGNANVEAIGSNDIQNIPIDYSGAGIGSGFRGNSYNIKIYDNATVETIGLRSGAGIGSGGIDTSIDTIKTVSENIEISGNANVVATGDIRGAGIGGGEGSIVSGIVIKDNASVVASGGTMLQKSNVYTRKDQGAAGIGSGFMGNSGDITIATTATVTATGDEGGAGIGSGKYGQFGSANITSGTIVATSLTGVAGIGSGLGGKVLNGTTGTSQEYKYPTSDITIAGDANVTAIAGRGGAGIGGGSDTGDVSNIIIKENAIVDSTGNRGGAGIGGGQAVLSVDNIQILDNATVKARSEQGTTIASESINGGIHIGGAGIGGGLISVVSNITITGATVTATGDIIGAGIGSAGLGGSATTGLASNITINGGAKVIATGGGKGGAGIGGGNNSEATNIVIADNATNVYAIGGSSAAGIGGGEISERQPDKLEKYNGAGYNVDIQGGTVVAVGGYNPVTKLGGNGIGDSDGLNALDTSSGESNIKISPNANVRAYAKNNFAIGRNIVEYSEVGSYVINGYVDQPLSEANDVTITATLVPNTTRNANKELVLPAGYNAFAHNGTAGEVYVHTYNDENSKQVETLKAAEDFHGTGGSSIFEYAESNIPVTDTIYAVRLMLVSEKPVINPVREDAKEITGKGIPGSTITVTLPDNTVITDILVSSDGNWLVEIPDRIVLKPNEVIKAAQQENKPANKAISVETESNVVPIGQSIPPVFKPITEGDSKVYGVDGVPGSKIKVTFPDGTVVDNIIVAEDGTWVVNVPKDIYLLEDEIVKATQTETGKHESTVTEEPVGHLMKQSRPPVINEIIEEDKTVSGTGIPGSIVKVIFPDGTVVDDIKVDDKGNWIVEVPTGITLIEGEIVKATQTETGKYESVLTEEPVGHLTKQSRPPVINDIIEGDRTVGGTGIPGSTVKVTFPDGTVVDNIKVTDNGTWIVNVPNGTNLVEGEIVSATQTEPNKTESNVTNEPVGHLSKQSRPPVISSITEGDRVVRGTGIPGSTVKLTFPDGTVIDSIPVLSNGTWSVGVPTGITLVRNQILNATQTEVGKTESLSTDRVVSPRVTDPGRPFIPVSPDPISPPITPEPSSPPPSRVVLVDEPDDIPLGNGIIETPRPTPDYITDVDEEIPFGTPVLEEIFVAETIEEAPEEAPKEVSAVRKANPKTNVDGKYPIGIIILLCVVALIFNRRRIKIS